MEWAGQDTPLYVNEIIEETHDVYTFRFQGDPLCRFAFWAGPILQPGAQHRRQKSCALLHHLVDSARPFVLEVTIKRVPGGLVSNWMPDNVKVGDRIEVAGPKGKFHLTPGGIPKKVLLLGAGSGLTPVMSMSRWLCDVAADVDIQFFNSVRSPDDIIFAKEIEYMAERYRMFSSVMMSETRGAKGEWQGLSGRITKPMMEIISPDLYEPRSIYVRARGLHERGPGNLGRARFRHGQAAFGKLRRGTDIGCREIRAAVGRQQRRRRTGRRYQRRVFTSRHYPPEPTAARHCWNSPKTMTSISIMAAVSAAAAIARPGCSAATST